MGTGYGLANKINDIFLKHRLKFLKILRLGPRFLIVLCIRGEKRCVLKINLFEKNINQDTKTHNEHLAREAFFLNYIKKQNQYPVLKNGVPIIYDCDLAGLQTWYLKDYAEGEFQNFNKSNFLFKDSFFTKENLNWIIKFFSELHRFSQNLPSNQKKLFHQHNLSDYLNLINGQRVKKIMGAIKITKIYHFFKKHEKIFNQNQSALTHFEPYPVHFIKHKKTMTIIDWENVGWGNSAHDIGVIWLRGFKHPAWQNDLIKKFPLQTPLKKHWLELFKTETIVQSLANLPYLKGTTDPDEKKLVPKIIKFLTTQIDLILNNKF